MIDSAWDHQQWIYYFRNDLAKSVDNDVRPLLACQGSFGIPRQFFPYIEYLAGLVLGPLKGKGDELSDSGRAVDFMKAYMPNYGACGWLLIHMWRDGTVHRYQPKTLEDGAGARRLGWLSYYGARTDHEDTLPIDVKATISHLKVWKNLNGTLDYLPVCMQSLVEDLDVIIKGVADLVENEKNVCGATLITNMRDAASIIRKPFKNVKYPFVW